MEGSGRKPEGTIIFPNDPSKPSEFVGESDSGDVVSPPLLNVERPQVEGRRIGFRLCGPEYGPGTMNE